MSTPLKKDTKRIRLLLAKSDLDGHDKGIRYMAEVLRNEGMEVILIRYRIPEEVSKVALEEDVDVIGLSLYGPGVIHDTSAVLNKLNGEHRSDILIILGGIIPDEYRPNLLQMGVRGIFGPGSSVSEVIESIRSGISE